MTIPGACLCGAVGFDLALPSRFVCHCHCTQCRRAHGAAFVTWAGFPEAALEIRTGGELLRHYRSGESGDRAFCGACGSSLFFRFPAAWPDEVHVAVGCLLAPLDRPPKVHVFFDDRAGFVAHADALPRAGGADGLTPLPDPGVSLRLLTGTPAERAQVQAVLEAAPTYHRLAGGPPAGSGEADGLFEALPPGSPREAKQVLGIEHAGRMIGCIDLVDDWPDPGTAMLGLLLLAEDVQRKGLGKAAYQALEYRIRARAGIRRIRIGVLDVNDRVLPFWTGLGFVATGALKPYCSGPVTAQVRVLEKPLLP